MPLGSISLGAGSTTGFDFQAIIDATMRAERQPIRELKSDIEDFEKTKSSFNELESLLTGFTDKLEELDSSSTFAAKKTSLSTEDAPFTVNTSSSAAPGTYDVEVSQLAQAHRVRSDAVADRNSPVVADGTITVQAGGYEEITVDVSSSSGNNSLRAIADAINDADEGVRASIVNDGTGSILVLRSEDTGTAHGMTISDTTNLNLGDPANELQAAQNAQASIDGIDVTSESNQISGAISGVTINLTGTTESPVTVSIDEDVDQIKEALTQFVDGYNELNTYFDEQFGSPEFRAASSVAGSSLVRGIQTSLQRMITGGISGIPDGKISSLSEVGIMVADETGRLEFDGAQFDRLVEQGRLGEIEAVLRSSGSTTDPSVVFDAAGSKTVSGTYDVTVSQAAERADVAGSTAVDPGGIAQDENLTIGVNGTETTVALTAGDTLSDIVSKTNTALEAAGVEGRAYSMDGKLHIRADDYGSRYTVTAVSDVAASTTSSGIGTSQLTDTGVDVQGTIGGTAAEGSGQSLIGAEGTDMEGLIVKVYATSDSIAAKGGNFGTVGYSEGLLDRINAQVETMTDGTDGLIKAALDSYDASIESAEDRIETIERRLAMREESLMRQFSAAERAISQLQAMQSQLSANL